MIIVCTTYLPFVGAFGVTNSSMQLCDLKMFQKPSGPTRLDGFAECPPNFSADLITADDGTLYGACFTSIDNQNSTNYKGSSWRAIDCRKRCSEFIHATRRTQKTWTESQPSPYPYPTRFLPCHAPRVPCTSTCFVIGLAGADLPVIRNRVLANYFLFEKKFGILWRCACQLRTPLFKYWISALN